MDLSAIGKVGATTDISSLTNEYLQPDVERSAADTRQRILLLIAQVMQLLKQQLPPGSTGGVDDLLGGGPAGGGAPGTPGGSASPGSPGSPGASATGGSPGADGASPTSSTPSGKANAGPFSTEPQSGQLSEAEGKQQAVKVAHQLMDDYGLTKEQAAGVAGNLYHESAGMNSNVNEFGSDPNSPTFGAPNSSQFGYGWAQWTGTRKDDFLNFCKSNGMDPASPAANYAMLTNELNGSESGTISALKSASTPEEAATTFRSVFERAANPVDEKRTAAAREIYNLM